MITSQNRKGTSTVVLVSGGGRGVTARCVVALAKNFPWTFILLGRTSIMAADPPWAEGIDQETHLKKAFLEATHQQGVVVTPQEVNRHVLGVLANREIRKTLTDLKHQGAHAFYFPVDIGIKDRITTTIREIEQTHGPISGIIHGAGALADKLIEKKTARDFAKVFTPKVDGLSNLLASVNLEQLRFLVLFSSVVSVSGNPGQADYAAANAILDRTAQQFHEAHPNCRVISVNWGPWEGGMVTPELKRAFQSRGVELIPLDRGAQTLVQLLKGRPPFPQTIVGKLPAQIPGSMPEQPVSARIRRSLHLRDNPFLLDHAIGGKAVLPATCGAAWLIQSTTLQCPAFYFTGLEDFRILKGIVFESDQSRDYLLEVRETSRSHDHLVLESQISSSGSKGNPLFHYRGKILLDSQPPVPKEEPPPFPAGFKPGNAQIGEELYQNGTLFHGPVFQGILEVTEPGENQLAMRCALPKVSRITQGQFPADLVNPFINDVAVQCLLVWSQRKLDAPCLPSRLHRFIQFKAIQFDTKFTVYLNVTDRTPASVTGDITVQDQQGKTCLKIIGLEGTVSAQLRRLIGTQLAR